MISLKMLILITMLTAKEDTMTVTATFYDAPVGTLTSDGSRIRKNVRWIAVSRDLLKIFGYGSKVEIESNEHSELNGIYEVHDTMNRRWKRRIDILSHIKHGKYKVRIVKKQ